MNLLLALILIILEAIFEGLKTRGLHIPSEIIEFIYLILVTYLSFAWLNRKYSIKDPRSLKSGLGITNLSDFFDCLWVFAGETKESSYKNLVKDLSHCTDVVAPTWTQFEGVQGNGTTQYINSNYSAASQGINYTANDASIGAYSRLTTPTNDRTKVGVNDYVGDSMCHIRNRNTTSGLMACAVNNYASTGVSAGINQGLTVAKRFSNTQYHVVPHSELDVIKSVNSSGTIPAKNFFICANNENGTANSFCDDQLALIFIAKYFDWTLLGCIYDAIQDYLYLCGDKAIHNGVNGGLSIGREMIVNGGFDTQSPWTYVYGDWTISGGVASRGVSSRVIRQKFDGHRNLKTYELTFTISNCASIAELGVIGNGGWPFDEFPQVNPYQSFANGTHTITLHNSGYYVDVYIEFDAKAGTATFDLDNVSIRRLT